MMPDLIGDGSAVRALGKEAPLVLTFVLRVDGVSGTHGESCTAARPRPPERGGNRHRPARPEADERRRDHWAPDPVDQRMLDVDAARAVPPSQEAASSTSTAARRYTVSDLRRPDDVVHEACSSGAGGSAVDLPRLHDMCRIRRLAAGMASVAIDGNGQALLRGLRSRI